MSRHRSRLSRISWSSVFGLLAVALAIVVFGPVGCSESSDTLSDPGVDLSTSVTIGGSHEIITGVTPIPLPAPGQEKLDQMLRIIDNVLSNNPARVQQGIEELELVEPRLYESIMNGLVQVFEGQGLVQIQVPYEETFLSADGTVCTTVTVTGTITIKKGSKVCYKNGSFETCTELDRDTVVQINRKFEYECEVGEGCTITHGSTTTVRINNENITWDWGGFSGNVTVSGELKVVVEVVTCPAEGR